jgi:DNA-binding NarL/FixJ family response regulator
MKKKKILIVEDELVVAEEMAEILTNKKYKICLILDNGEEAISAVEEHQPDLVLMDIKLSGKLTGVQAAIQIHEKFKTPIVFITAYADEKTLEGAIQADPYGYLVKPIREKDITSAVKIAFHMIEREGK